jgi:ribosomal protein S18 acetylase RimI-like enzyme
MSKEKHVAIRPTVHADTPALIALAEGTGVFKPLEIDTLDEVMSDYYAVNRSLGHKAFALEVGGRVVGFTYHAPAAMTDRAWYLYWIAVEKDDQARGVGGRLLRAVEEDVAKAGGRVLFIETSGMPHYELTRRFYLKHGYEQAAVVHDYYADGDHMVIFRKRFVG